MSDINNHITVVMPVFNRDDFLLEAIESLFAQEYVHYDLIIVDDGSTNPKIREILDKFTDHPQCRIFCLERHRGQSCAINIGAQKAKGPYLCRLDSDDKLLPNALTVLNQYINQNPHISYFYSSRFVIDENSRIVRDENCPEGIHRSKPFNKDKIHQNYHCNHLICWRKEHFLSVGGMRVDIHWAEDWDLAVRMAKKYQFQNIHEVLYCYRVHDNNSVTQNLSDKEKDAFTDMFLAGENK